MGKRICLLILCMFLFITSACAVYALPKEDLQAAQQWEEDAEARAGSEFVYCKTVL